MSPNVGGALRNPSLIVMHYSVSDNMAGTLSWLRNQKSKASYHALVDRDGTVEYLVPLDRVAWHAGKSSWGGRPGVNSFSLGICCINWGPLKRSPDGIFTPVAGTKVIAPEDVFTGRHKNGQTRYAHWQRFPEPQIAAVDALIAELFQKFPSLREVVGHDDVAPGRKTDPGPAFDAVMRQLQAKFNRA